MVILNTKLKVYYDIFLDLLYIYKLIFSIPSFELRLIFLTIEMNIWMASKLYKLNQFLQCSKYLYSY